MFMINPKRLKEEEKEKGYASLHYFEGYCQSCEHSDEVGERCKKYGPLDVNIRVTAGIVKSSICREWVLRNHILQNFKKNGSKPTSS